MWLFEETGAFGFPRVGIEAEGGSWDNRRYQANFAFPDGRILNGADIGPAHDPQDKNGEATILGAGPLLFQCLEPFRRWRVAYDGDAVDSHVKQQITQSIDPSVRTPVRFDVELTMAAPAWVQDNSPERLASMTEAERIEAANMGIGYRIEQLCRAEGVYEIDGETRKFRGVGSRIHRQSVRPLSGFRGHCWQAAVFPDGRAFGYIAYPPREDGSDAYNEGFVYIEGRMLPARAVTIPWLKRLAPTGDDVSLELESELGRHRIDASTTMSTFRVGNPDIGGFNLQQSGVRYRWDDEETFGMIERSLPGEMPIG